MGVYMKRILVILITLLCMPVMANEKVEFCQEYKSHLQFMKDMETKQNFSYSSEEWKAAEDKKEVLTETGKMIFGDDVRITSICAGLLGSMKSSQLRNYK